MPLSAATRTGPAVPGSQLSSSRSPADRRPAHPHLATLRRADPPGHAALPLGPGHLRAPQPVPPQLPGGGSAGTAPHHVQSGTRDRAGPRGPRSAGPTAVLHPRAQAQQGPPPCRSVYEAGMTNPTCALCPRPCTCRSRPRPRTRFERGVRGFTEGQAGGRDPSRAPGAASAVGRQGTAGCLGRPRLPRGRPQTNPG